MVINGQQIKQKLLEAINKYSNLSTLQSGTIFQEVEKSLDTRSREMGQAVLTIWYDLFRIGYLAWGVDINNPNPPFFHLTETGRKALQHLSRDPANPDGYLAYLSSIAKLNPIAESYVNEGLKTYNAGCYKATSVMIGVAAESILLDLRVVLINKLKQLGKIRNKSLEDWRIKKVLDEVKKLIDAKKNEIPKELFENYEAYWLAFVQQIRMARNDAGHPSDLVTITEERVHASLLIFPESVKLTESLSKWIDSNYK